MKNSKCNLCGNSDFESVYKRNNIEVITSRENFKIDINNVICKKCGLVFQNPVMEKEKLANFYSDQYRVDESKGETVRKQQKEYLDKFISKKKGVVLDIGSFEGVFLNLFKKEGWTCIGVEPCQEAAKICREKYNIEVYEEMFENINFDDNMFDIIAIRHVLEHVDDPMNAIKLMKRYLKDDGIIFIEVPDISKFDSDNIADSYDFQHIYNFSSSVMKNYIFKCGLELVDTDNELPYAGMRFICKKGIEKDIVSDYENTKALVLNYKKKREENLNYMASLLVEKNKQWKVENKKIFLYGAGFHTAQLFQYVMNKEDFNIVGLLDSSKDKWEKEFWGYKTYSADKIGQLDADVIIISSYAFQDEIYNMLKRFERVGVEIVKLYRKTYSYDTL